MARKKEKERERNSGQGEMKTLDHGDGRCKTFANRSSRIAAILAKVEDRQSVSQRELIYAAAKRELKADRRGELISTWEKR